MNSYLTVKIEREIEGLEISKKSKKNQLCGCFQIIQLYLSEWIVPKKLLIDL